MQPGIQIVMARCIRARSRRVEDGRVLVRGCGVFRGVLEAGGVVTRGPRVNDHPLGIRVCVGSYTATTRLSTYTVTFLLLLLLLLLRPTGSSSSVSLLPESSCTRTVWNERGYCLRFLLYKCYEMAIHPPPPPPSSSSSRDTQFIGLIIAFLLCEYD